MAIKFADDKKVSLENLKTEYFKAARSGENPETVEAKYNEYMSEYANVLKDNILAEARQNAQNETSDTQIRMNRGLNVLTSEERKFFKNLVEDEAELDTYKEEALLPETTVVRVFEDIKTERPLLSKINFNLSGIRTRMIVGDPAGAAMWGEVFGKIQGQISANFNEFSFSQNKLTAFAIVPKDLIEFGYEWVERYVREQLAEAIGAKLEEGIVLGNGALQNQPVGITKDMTKDEDGNITAVADKKPAGELTFADARTTAIELANLMNSLSVKENGKRINVAGKVSLVVNPGEQFLIQAQYTTQTVNGQWVTSLPFNLDIVASEFVPEGQVIALVGERYHAMYTGAVQIREYDQTLALEDVNVYVAKQFAHGVPDDNKASQVYTLALTKEEVPEVPEVPEV